MLTIAEARKASQQAIQTAVWIVTDNIGSGFLHRNYIATNFVGIQTPAASEATHVRRGNAVGAVELLRRAADRVEKYAADPPYGVDAAGLVAWARSLVASIEHGSLAALPAADLVPRLRP